jgi:SAM-dependent methyltransferase
MGEVFTRSEYDRAYPQGIETHFWNIARHDALLQALRGLELEDALIMDVGCGAGITTRYLHERGFNIRGVEQGDAPVPEQCRGYISTGQDLFALEEALQRDIRCILLLDVIEHMAEREAFLCDIHQQLPECSYLVLTVSARRELWTNFDEYWGHQLRYDRPTLAGELQRSGFRVRKNSYHFHLVYLAGLLLKTLGIERDTGFSPPQRSRAAGLLHRLLGYYGRLENRLLPGFLPGSSLVCIAERIPR